jgi:hypothetical protein
MPKEPEEMLIQNWITTTNWIKKGSIEVDQ